MDRMDRFKRLWNRLERATEEEDIKEAITNIHNALNFSSCEESIEWTDLMADFTNWNKMKFESFKIAEKGRNLFKDYDYLKDKISQEKWITIDCKRYLVGCCYGDREIDIIINKLRNDKLIRWW